VFLNPLKDLAAQGEHRAIISAAHADLIFGRCRTTRSPFFDCSLASFRLSHSLTPAFSHPRVVPLHLMHRELLEEFKKGLCACACAVMRVRVRVRWCVCVCACVREVMTGLW
jgi:hypothetical protein